MRRGATAIALLALAASARGQPAELRAEVDATRVGVEDVLQLTLSVSGSAEAMAGQVPPPQLTNLRVVGGPSVSTQISMVNGNVSQSKSVTWVLQAEAPGEARIAPFEMSLDGESHRTEAIAIEVVPGSVRPQRAARRPDPFGDPFADLFDSPFRRRAAPEPKLAVRAIPNRERVHVGEPVLLTYWLYTTVLSITNWSADVQFPGFWAETLERPSGSLRGEEATLEGEPARRFAIDRRLLFPTQAGERTIPAGSFRLALAARSVFDGGSVVEREVAPVTIQVDPLPQAPGFTGAVGRFTASTSVDRSELAIGDAATLRFRVEGSGNLKWIEEPPQIEVPGARVYPPQVSSDVQIGADGARGSKTWEFVVIPETGGALEIPPVPFAWFDPQSDRIERLETAPIPLTVTGGRGALVTGAAARAESPRGLALRAELEGGGLAASALPPRALLLILGAGLLAHLGLWLGPRLAERGFSGGGTRSRGSVRGALAELARVDGGDLSKEAAAGAIEKALHEAFGDLGGEHSDPRAPEARELLEQVQLIRYAPQLGDYSEPLRELAGRARALIRRRG